MIDNKVIDFNRFISSISMALDLAEACIFKDKSKKFNFSFAVPGFSVFTHNFATHSKRTTLVSKFIAEKMGLDEKRQSNLYIASFLHDIGAVDAFSVCHSDSNFIYEHSEFGSNIIKNLPVDKKISKYIKFHHENYDGSGPNGLKGSEIPEEASIIHLADIFELMYKDEAPYYYQKNAIIDWFKDKSGSIFSPDAVDAFLELSSKERFWLDVENINTDTDILLRIQPKIYTPLSLSDTENISNVFAALIDKKSAFTHRHSVEIMDKASKFCRIYDFDQEKSTKLKIAALLHDLGKLSIPNDILDKPGKLTQEEFAIIKSHTYYTKLILNKIDGMEDIADWAANHHETLDGKGYPEGLDAKNLSLESRIIAVCDIYQALTEERPYRKGMQIDKALSIIDSAVEGGKLDKDVVKKLKEII